MDIDTIIAIAQRHQDAVAAMQIIRDYSNGGKDAPDRDEFRTAVDEVSEYLLWFDGTASAAWEVW